MISDSGELVWTFGFNLVPTYDRRPATYTSHYVYFASKDIEAHEGSELD